MPARTVVAVATVVALAGCASTAVDQNLADVRQLSRERLGSDVKWLTTDDARRQAETDVDALLAKPLSGDDAVRIALAYSPALQTLLYEAAASSAAATQSARLPNPVFAFERLARNEGGVRELEITRSLSFSVLDLLLLPARLRLADYQQQATRLTLASNVVQAASEARQAWVNAVAAQQSVQYAQQVKATADASAEIARRMQAVGNFSKLQRAREQAFAADAVAQLARASQAARSAREMLVRSLGLNERQAAALQLPDRLPLREDYGAYRTAYDIARHYRDEIVPLRKTIAEENMLRYNGMLIGVFELLADSRDQIASVMQAIEAQRDFWLADAALQTTLIGKPRHMAMSMPRLAPAARPRRDYAAYLTDPGTKMTTERRKFLVGGAGAGMAVAAASVSRVAMAALPEPVMQTKPDTMPPLVPNTGRPYNPVVTLNGWTLPWRMNNGVKEFHLVAEPVVREMAPGFKAHLWGYNGQSPGPDDRGGRRRPGAHLRHQQAARAHQRSTGTASACPTAWTASPA